MLTRIDLYACQISVRTTWHFIRLVATDGIGYGECSDAGDSHAICQQLESLSARIWPDRRDLGAVLAELDQQAAACAPGNLLRSTVIGGLEHAVVDLIAQFEDKSLTCWLGAQQLERVPLYANLNRVVSGRDVATYTSIARQAHAAGFRAMKIAPFDVVDQHLPLAEIGLRRVRAVRDAVGSDTELMVDCHQRLIPAQLDSVLPAFDEIRLRWLEDACPAEDATGLRKVRELTSTPLAGGELLTHPAQARQTIEEALLDVVLPDVKHAGGIRRAQRLALAADPAATAPHNPVGPIATAVSAHLLAAVPHPNKLEYAFGEIGWRSELVHGMEQVESGQLIMPQGSGIGVSLHVEHPAVNLLWTGAPA